jgi:hypothetical protein
MAFPTSLDTFPGTVAQGTSLISSPDHASDHRTLGSAAYALEQKLGIGSGTPTANKVLIGSGNGTSIWGTEWDNAILGTPTIGTITVPGTVIPLTPSAALSPASGSIADSPSGTMTINAQSGQIFYSVLGTTAGNRTIGTPYNPTAWQSLLYAFKTSGSTNATLVWSSGAFTFSQDIGTPALGTGVTWNYYAWRYNSITSRWEYQGQSKNII